MKTAEGMESGRRISDARFDLAQAERQLALALNGNNAKMVEVMQRNKAELASKLNKIIG